MKLFDFALLLTCVASATAHGGVYTYNISGSIYQGNPWHIWDYGPFYGNGNASGIPDGINSIQRRWYFWPLYDVSDGNMTCNFDGVATTNSLHAPVAAGSTIIVQYNALQFTLTTVDKTIWFHQYGPLLVYMARCPGDTCQSFDGKGAVWFKIAQYGLAPGAVNLRGPWLQASMLEGENATGFQVTIPKDLRPGNYLIRHEVINLQSSTDYGAQFYVECAQLKVEGSGDKFPNEEYMATFPGAYKLSDPGIALAGNEISDGDLLPQYNTTDYPFPGPPVWNSEI
ncbi:Uncharacterized protein BP5553_02735 [Venustampulla echinocandica]|uniref:AA9 family lytic polysaccharide monooxygenase n=1 Tax=Venustampulla echinocandica TaxID=2656787 RepID=A0A370TS89_9HELO|nr:Uncharacterized protein BP5553_02735 [Venustampulla echinocandica]RDL38395.1 Uncharacterized protein BP5553_02735 [Venustampulla echinocandica]